ncbi:MAG: MFS transporter [Haloferacaceae archaeon]
MSRHQHSSTGFVIGTVSLAHFLSHFYFLVFPPLFPLFRAEFDVSNTQLGLLFSLLFFMPSILQLPVGDLVDRIGAKRVFVAGIAVTGVGVMATTLANSYPALLAFALLAGVGQSVFHPADFALIETVTDETTRGKGFGTHTFAGFLGFAAGPLIAGGLGIRYGWRPALLALGSIGVVYAVAVLLTMAPVHRGRELGDGSPGADEDENDDGGGLLSNWALLLDPRILATFAFFVLLTVSSTGIQSFTVVFLTDVFDLSNAVANTTLTANLTATAVGVLAGGVLADRLNIYAILVGTLAVACALTGVIVAGVLPSTLVITLGLFVVLGFAHGLALPSRDSLVSEFSTSDSTGKSFGFAYTGVTVGAAVAPVMFGVVSDTVNNVAMYSLVGVFYAAAVLTVVLLYVRFVRVRPEPAVG